MMRRMSPEAPAAVLFDNDGLLLDTESVWTRAEEDLFEQYGHEFTPEHKRELVGTSADLAAGKLERWLGEDGRKLELMAELDALVVAEPEHGVEAMVGARDLLEKLKAQGTPIGLVSNSPLPFVLRSLEIVGFEGIFDAVVSGHESRRRSPRPIPTSRAAVASASRPARRDRAGGLADRGRRRPRRRPHRDRRALDRRRRARRGPSHRRVAARRPRGRAGRPRGQGSRAR